MSKLRYHKFVCATHALHLRIDVLGARKGLGICVERHETYYETHAIVCTHVPKNFIPQICHDHIILFSRFDLTAEICVITSDISMFVTKRNNHIFQHKRFLL